MGLWTSQHVQTVVPSLIVSVIAALLLQHALGRKERRIRMIPFQILAVIVVLLEIGKQLVSFSRGYDLYHIPLHVCSVVIILMPLMAFYRGRWQKGVETAAAALCSAVFLFMMIYPNLIYSPGNVEGMFQNFLDFHTVAFHNLAVFGFFLILLLDLHRPVRGGRKGLSWFMLGYSLVAAGAAHLLKTNYANFYSCNIPVFEALRLSLRESWGALPAQLLYVAILILLHVLCIQLFYSFYLLAHRLVSGRKEKAEQQSAA